MAPVLHWGFFCHIIARMNRLTDAPKNLLWLLWVRLWSPWGLILLGWLYYSGYLYVPEKVEWGYVALAVGAVLTIAGVKKISRWWRFRPRVQIVEKEKIVYRDRPAPAEQMSRADRMLKEYADKLELIDKMPITEKEKEVARGKAKTSIIKKLDEEL